MSITTRPYGKDHHGNAVTEYTLTGATGASFSVLDFGATLTRVCMPDRAGKLGDVILGYDTAEEYTRNGGYLGASVGRFGNRIGGAAFDIEGRSYKLDKNDGENSLHGGFDGFSHRMWAVKTDEKNTSIEFALTSPDGDQGFPGKLDVTVT
ncbi:MAG: galactose-1-epimerase, partial [Eubacteriales bacterium]|nr:galactose-1-epimerase [Eubacteriales bacterium]